MGDRIKIVKGFQDIVPPESEVLARLDALAMEVFPLYGFCEIRLPVLEHTELFARSIGQGTDIVDKEMFTFPDRKGRSLSLRPEGTAGAVRAYLCSGKAGGEPVRWWYRGPMFRYERPQKGRYRQFYQIGAEAIGFPGPGTDAQILAMLDRFFKEAGVTDLRLDLNSLGCGKCRPAYREKLVAYLHGVEEKLCHECKKRIERNPLRVMDCKEEECKSYVKDAPRVLDFLDDDCKAHFEAVKKDLDTMGIEYEVNPYIVRGLDYYTRTVFEHLAGSGLGAQNTVAAGGRYDDLVEELGGPLTPAMGFAVGVERIAMLMKSGIESRPDCFIVYMEDSGRRHALELLESLREHGRRAEMVLDKQRSIRSQMKAASKAGSRYAVIIGLKEVEDIEKENLYKIKDMESGKEFTVSGQDLLKGSILVPDEAEKT